MRITTTNICGSDLHMYEGRTDVEQGKILGHENMGVVEEVGTAVDRIKAGDRVSLPFNIACGTCRNCNAGLTGYCLRVNPTARARRTATRRWGRTRAVRPSTCGFPTPTSTR